MFLFTSSDNWLTHVGGPRKFGFSSQACRFGISQTRWGGTFWLSYSDGMVQRVGFSLMDVELLLATSAIDRGAAGGV